MCSEEGGPHEAHVVMYRGLRKMGWVDEPEDDSMALLMGGEPDKPAEDDMSEENLLRALMEAQGQG